MGYRHALSDEQWEKIKDFLPGKEGDPGRSAADNRKFINAVMWISRTGTPWRDMPPEIGSWMNVHKRFMRWSRGGIWQKIFNTIASNEDNDWLMIDSTIVKVHQDGAWGKKSKYETQPRRA